ncbi:putative diguanylate cyclase AdrA [Pseudidiomarina piscicola]|uniref:diguanylate cyclase n=2 Tax=Pseudidiomarina piscicola TaxID=2614830 RepID=A0A6S6WRM0_9GAMM|nr:putative diguanylate cyclase AdrA [Pseudidiomarina piscicola]VZT40376.1 putative diguanylate cyclase AdrA [Pseudomonas aeruginosa]
MDYQPFVSLWYPPAALSLAAFILVGGRAFLPIVMAATLAGLWMYLELDTHTAFHQQTRHSLLLAFAHTISYGLGGLYFRKTIHKWDIQQLPQRILYFLIITLFTTFLAASSGIIAFIIIGEMSWAQAEASWLNWWVGDLAGAMVLTPFFILLLSRLWNSDISWLKPKRRRQNDETKRLWSSKMLLNVAIVMVVILADHYFNHASIAYFIFFISIPQMWIVYTERMEYTVISLALMSTMIAAWFGFYGVSEHALTYQFAMCVIAANAYFGLAVPSLLSQNKKLHHQTQIDTLTHIASRNHFFEVANNEIKQLKEQNKPLSLALFDLDEFKSINDTYGHLIGDQALIMAAQSISTHIRDRDLIARFGGDEFLLLLPGQTKERAHLTADRLRQKLPAIPTPEGHIPIRASFGVVEINVNESLTQALQRADQALLNAKRKGRDQVVSS